MLRKKQNTKVEFICFTQEMPGVTREIVTPCGVSQPFRSNKNVPAVHQFTAVWDTGATGSVISSAVAVQLGLVPITKTEVRTANGVTESNVYAIGLHLPNGARNGFLQVTEMPAIAGAHPVLIGMDVMSVGDVAISNHGGRTVFTFRMPSVGRIDFAREVADQDYEHVRHLPRRQRVQLLNPKSGQVETHEARDAVKLVKDAGYALVRKPPK